MDADELRQRSGGGRRLQDNGVASACLYSSRRTFTLFLISLTLVNLAVLFRGNDNSSSFFRCDYMSFYSNSYPSTAVVVEVTTNTSEEGQQQQQQQAMSHHLQQDRPLKKKEKPELPYYTLVVVRCRKTLEWLHEVPSDNNWRIVVYEKCLSQASPIQPTNNRTTVITTAINGGAEECNGYFDYLYDYYDTLTEITIFFHEDGLKPYNKPGRTYLHTDFTNFSEVVDATNEFLVDPAKNNTFIHLGTKTISDYFGRDNYHGESQKVLWPYLRTSTQQYPPTRLVTKPSAHMAVRKEAILSRPKETYWSLLQQSRYVNDVNNKKWQTSRQICCAMERMWHMLFGLPPELPKSAMVYDLLKKRRKGKQLQQELRDSLVPSNMTMMTTSGETKKDTSTIPASNVTS